MDEFTKQVVTYVGSTWKEGQKWNSKTKQWEDPPAGEAKTGTVKTEKVDPDWMAREQRAQEHRAHPSDMVYSEQHGGWVSKSEVLDQTFVGNQPVQEPVKPFHERTLGPSNPPVRAPLQTQNGFHKQVWDAQNNRFVDPPLPQPRVTVTNAAGIPEVWDYKSQRWIPDPKAVTA